MSCEAIKEKEDRESDIIIFLGAVCEGNILKKCRCFLRKNKKKGTGFYSRALGVVLILLFEKCAYPNMRTFRNSDGETQDFRDESIRIFSNRESQGCYQHLPYAMFLRMSLEYK